MKSGVGTTSVFRRYRVGVCAAVLLGGCAPHLPTAGPSYRDETVTLAATTRFDLARFSGEWDMVARVPVGAGRPPVRFAPDDPDCALDFVLHDPDDWPELRNTPGCFSIEVSRPGVLSVTFARQTFPDLVAMWVDEDFNTAAIGWADGGAAYILTRPGKARADQIAAATEVLAFNGWDVSKVKVQE